MYTIFISIDWPMVRLEEPDVVLHSHSLILQGVPMKYVQKLIAVMAMIVFPGVALSDDEKPDAAKPAQAASAPKAAVSAAKSEAKKAEPKKEETSAPVKAAEPHENRALGIYLNSQEGLKACLEDLKTGKVFGYYQPKTKNPLTDSSYEVKTVGKGGACLTQATVAEETGGKAFLGTVAVKEGFKYGQKQNIYRMFECSNAFSGIFTPSVQTATQLPAPQSAPAPQAVAAPVETPAIRQRVDVDVDVNVNVHVNVEATQKSSATPAAPASQVCPEGKNCTPRRNPNAGVGEDCRFKQPGNRNSIECNFPWKVLRTQDQIANCGCQLLVPEPRQIVGFPDAQPGSPRCAEQKKMWADTLGLKYSSTRFTK